MGVFLQTSQVEAHIARLLAIRTQCANYKETDGRAVDAIAGIDSAIESLRQEPFAPQGVLDLCCDGGDGCCE